MSETVGGSAAQLSSETAVPQWLLELKDERPRAANARVTRRMGAGLAISSTGIQKAVMCEGRGMRSRPAGRAVGPN
jgi:hypothetical protein